MSILVLALFIADTGLSTRISLINFRTPAGIFEINLFGDAQLIENLNAQNGLFSVVETSASQATSRLVRSVAGGIHTPRDGIAAAIHKLAEPQVKSFH